MAEGSLAELQDPDHDPTARRYDELEEQSLRVAQDGDASDEEDGSDADEQVSEDDVRARLEAEMGSASSNLVEASFVSRVQGRVIQLFDESVHFADMKPNEMVTVRTPPRRKWSARCGGVTVVLWPVPAGGAAFELGADVKLPQARSRRSVAGTRPSGRFSVVFCQKVGEALRTLCS